MGTSVPLVLMCDHMRRNRRIESVIHEKGWYRADIDIETRGLIGHIGREPRRVKVHARPSM